MSRHAIAAILYGVVLALLMVFSFDYFFATTLQPHHAAALNLDPVLPPGEWAVFRGLYRSIASGQFVLAAVMLAVLFVPFRRREPWARIVLSLGSASYAGLVLFTLLQFRAATGITPSAVYAATLALLLVGAAHILGSERRADVSAGHP